MLRRSCLRLQLVDEQLDEDRSLDRLLEDGALAAVEDDQATVGK
jgi:hypothetical protein